MTKQKKYFLDDLPKYSSWPARLLGLTTWKKRILSPKEILREYEDEKWGSLLLKMDKSRKMFSLENIEKLYLGRGKSLCSVGYKLKYLSIEKAHDEYLNLVIDTLAMHLPAKAIVELGAGYGSIILAVAKHKKFQEIPLFAGEYTNSGIELIKRIAETEKINITAGYCDLNSERIANFEIPSGSIIFTSNAIPYVKRLSEKFVNKILSYSPKAVIHIEPCFEHYQRNNLLDLMRKKYILINDYNINLVSLLHHAQTKGLIQIIVEKPAVFGINSLLPVSIIVWIPN